MTEWGKRNGRAAGDLARLDVTPEQCVAAWHSATARIGAPVRTIQIVQDELGRQALPAQRRAPARPTRANDRNTDYNALQEATQRPSDDDLVDAFKSPRGVT